MTEDAKNDVRSSIENLVRLSREAIELNTEYEELTKRQKTLHNHLDIARQQNFISCVDLLRSEQSEILKDREFFHFIMSSLISWKHYESRQNRESAPDPQKILRDMFNPHIHETYDTAERIFENANLNLTDGMNVEKALNEELQKLGFSLSLLHSLQSQDDGSYHVGIFLMACVDDVELFIREAPSYTGMFDTLASTSHFSRKEMEEDNATSDFSFAIILREYYHEQVTSLEDMPVVRAEPVESPFDDMDGETPTQWSVYTDIQHMAEGQKASSHQEMMRAVHELHQLSRLK